MVTKPPKPKKSKRRPLISSLMAARQMVAKRMIHVSPAEVRTICNMPNVVLLDREYRTVKRGKLKKVLAWDKRNKDSTGHTKRYSSRYADDMYDQDDYAFSLKARLAAVGISSGVLIDTTDSKTAYNVGVHIYVVTLTRKSREKDLSICVIDPIDNKFIAPPVVKKGWCIW